MGVNARGARDGVVPFRVGFLFLLCARLIRFTSAHPYDEWIRHFNPKGRYLNAPKECDDPSKNPLCSRPLIVLKLARSGSSYFAQQIRESVTGNQFGVEVTDCMQSTDNCTEVVATVEAALLKSIRGPGISGFTLNPFKYHDAGSRCGDGIAALVRDHRGVVAVLERDNVLAQTTSFLISSDMRKKHVLENLTNSARCDPYHLYRCENLPDSLAHYHISPDPHDFVKDVQDKVSLTRSLKSLASEWTDSNFVSLHFEEIIQFPIANRTLAEWVQSCILCACDCDGIPYAARRNEASSLKEKISNFDEVREYVKANAAHFLEWLEG